MQKNLEKCGHGRFKSQERRAQEVPKSTLERPKSRKKRPKGATNAARREKCTQEALKSEKCANIEPTWPQHGGKNPTYNSVFAPPSKLMQKLKSNKCLWGLTRLALQAARRIFFRFRKGFGRPKCSKTRDFGDFCGCACGDFIFG